jgi:hypothetical protein
VPKQYPRKIDVRAVQISRSYWSCTVAAQVSFIALSRKEEEAAGVPSKTAVAPSFRAKLEEAVATGSCLLFPLRHRRRQGGSAHSQQKQAGRRSDASNRAAKAEAAAHSCRANNSVPSCRCYAVEEAEAHHSVGGLGRDPCGHHRSYAEAGKVGRRNARHKQARAGGGNPEAARRARQVCCAGGKTAAHTEGEEAAAAHVPRRIKRDAKRKTREKERQESGTGREGRPRREASKKGGRGQRSLYARVLD